MGTLRGYGEHVDTCSLGFVEDIARSGNDSNPVKSDVEAQFQTAIDLMGLI